MSVCGAEAELGQTVLLQAGARGAQPAWEGGCFPPPSYHPRLWFAQPAQFHGIAGVLFVKFLFRLSLVPLTAEAGHGMHQEQGLWHQNEELSGSWSCEENLCAPQKS